MQSGDMLVFAAQSAAAAENSSASLILLGLLGAAAVWLVWRVFAHRARAAKAEAALHDDFAAFVLQALASAALIDGQVGAGEREAIAAAIGEIAGERPSVEGVEAALAAQLSKDDLLAYLDDHAARLSHEQKVGFLRALLSVFVADGKFDESEHQALIEFTAAVGFDRQSAPGRLRGLLSDMARGRVIT
jgi:uncharacterized membrane protein YebE (DUF533 family)